MRTREVRRARMIAALAGVAMLAACQGHGKYTAEGVTAAERRMAALKAATEFDMAEQALRSGELDKAERKIEVALALAPDVATSYVLLARVRVEQGRIGDALAALERSLELDPERAETHYYLGIVSERLRRAGDAFTHFAEAARLEPQDPQFTVAAAEMLVDEGQIDAAEDFLLASKVVDHAPAVKQLLGHISMIRGLPAEAADRFTDAWLLSPSDAVIHEDLITAQVAAGRYAEAEAGIRDLLNDPDAGHASAPRDLEHMRAMCLIALGRPMDARQIYRKLTSNADGASDVEAWIGLGRSSFLVGDLRRLGLASERVRTLAPGRPEGRALTALWHRAKGDPGAALGALRGFAFDDPEVLTLRALILADLGRFEESRQQLYAVLDAVPDDDAAMGLLDRLPEIEGTYAVAPTDR